MSDTEMTTVEVSTAAHSAAKRAIIGSGFTLKEFSTDALIEKAAKPLKPKRRPSAKSKP